MNDRPPYEHSHPPRRRKLLAWSAHVYTALGLVLAAIMAVCIVIGGAEAFRWAFACMLAACLVDATDGSYARRVHVKDVLPNFDGSKLDDLIDFLTFTSLPLLLVWRAALLPPGAEWLLVVALVASAYGFCQVPAKTIDGYFVGFPSYWNIVAFYLYVLQIPGWVAAGAILALAVLTFVPSYYVYPSRGATLSKTTNFLGGVWVVLLVWILWDLPAEELASGKTVPSYDRTSALVSLFYPVYYLAISWAITLARWYRGWSLRV
ncbi:MAG: phosphatidylcholine/phosphatidylserine synthase [Pirellulales bacterium]